MTGDLNPQLSSLSALGLVATLQTQIAELINSREAERGATMAEYGLLIALVFIAGIATLSVFGVSVAGLFQLGVDGFDNAPGLNP